MVSYLQVIFGHNCLWLCPFSTVLVLKAHSLLERKERVRSVLLSGERWFRGRARGSLTIILAFSSFSSSSSAAAGLVFCSFSNSFRAFLAFPFFRTLWYLQGNEGGTRKEIQWKQWCHTQKSPYYQEVSLCRGQNGHHRARWLEGANLGPESAGIPLSPCSPQGRPLQSKPIVQGRIRYVPKRQKDRKEALLASTAVKFRVHSTEITLSCPGKERK